MPNCGCSPVALRREAVIKTIQNVSGMHKDTGGLIFDLPHPTAVTYMCVVLLGELLQDLGDSLICARALLLGPVLEATDEPLACKP
jgi:hypothetical protein